MNRIVLIGNGFDLAHKMKTSYREFIESLLLNSFTKCNESNTGVYQDDFFAIKRNSLARFELSDETQLSDYLKFTVSDNPIDRQYFAEPYNKNWSNAYSFYIKNVFIKDLLEKTNDLNWVDIEDLFYKSLKNIFRSNSQESILGLNSTFALLIEKLNAYLSVQKPNKISDEFLRIFGMSYHETHVLPKQTLLLDFNYTGILSHYLQKFLNESDYTHLQIHGSVNDKKNPIIFGYGDELDKEYKEIEDLNDNRFLTYFKTYHYALNSNYSRLNGFINSDVYEVYILGHSCGLSDRVMLNSIFENDNCQSIRIFYFKNENLKDNFIDIYQNISRHFSVSNRGKLRNKIVNKELSLTIPQL
jgi:Bacteriophage abortive infection AbiH